MVKGQDSGSFPLVSKHPYGGEGDRKDKQGCTPAYQGVTSVYHHLFLSNAGSVMRVTLCSHGFVNSPLSKKATSRIICNIPF